MTNCKVLTIGYEGREIDDFISRLKNFNVTRLIDVREVPLSRKRGFSKSAIRERLNSENIEYVHLRSLGCPSKLRYKLKADWDYDHFFEAYLEYLSKNQDAIAEVQRYISDGVNCIMCFERYPDKCHRSALVNRIKEYNGNGLKITHILEP